MPIGTSVPQVRQKAERGQAWPPIRFAADADKTATKR
jgi:hypothetical protein